MARVGGEVVALVVAMAILCPNNFITVKGADDLQEKCSNEFVKLQDCIKYSSGKESKPSEKCCKSASEIREKYPVCLCYIIQQTSKGSSQTNSAGIRIDRVLELPTICQIPDANPSRCPELLKLPAGSPDNAIFNGSIAATTNASNYGSNHESSGLRIGPNYSTPSIAAAAVSAIVWSIFS